jgi:hypothetical protein
MDTLDNTGTVRYRPDESSSIWWTAWRLFGRFYWARRSLGILIGLFQGYRKQNVESPLFSNTLMDAAVASLRKDAVAFGFNLPSSDIADIRKFAHETELIQENYPERSFVYKDCQGGFFADKAPIPLAYAKNARLCPAVMRLVHDPVILEIAARYLGYRPRYFRDRLWFSFTGDHDLQMRRKMNQTVDFHFDLPGSQFTFFYVNFYLSDVDSRSGAHTLVKASHRNKPLGMALGRSRRSLAEIERAYGAEYDTVIEGAAGTGFLEDASCYHRALAPVERERLMLQIRYF